MKRKTTIEIEGVNYEAVLGKIERAFIGFEDHGIFTAFLTFSGPGWGQAEAARFWTPVQLELYLKSVLTVLGVTEWDKVKGQEVFVLRERGMVVGIAHRSEDRHMFFQEIAGAENKA